MKITRKFICNCVVLATLFLIIGCGGGGSSNVPNNPLPPPPSSSDPLDTWKTLIQTKSNSFGPNPLLKFVNDAFIVLGSRSIVTSPDGANWTFIATNILISEKLVDVTYGNGTYVALSNNGTILTSTDLIDWTSKSIGIQTPYNTFLGIAYGNGFFVVVADSGFIFVSNDGVNWKIGASKDTPNFSNNAVNSTSIAYGNGTFVVTAPNGVYTSPDGIHWEIADSRVLSGITYQDNTFLAFGSHDVIDSFLHTTTTYYQVFLSKDGLQWTQTSNLPKVSAFGVTTQGYFKPTSVTYVNGSFIVTGRQSAKNVNPGYSLFISNDGSNWITKDLSTDLTVTYGKGSFVAAGTSLEVIFSSDDLDTWAPRMLGNSFVFNGIAFGNNTFAILTSAGVFTSTDGAKWKGNLAKLNIDISSGITYLNGQFVIGSGAYSSTDGMTWISFLNSHIPYSSSSVTYGNGVYVVLEGQDTYTTVFITPDGVNWKSKVIYSPQLNAITFGNGKFIAVGMHGTIVTSPDGENWSQQNSNTFTDFIEVKYAGGIYFVQGSFTSSDGINWTNISASTHLTFTDITFGNGIFVGPLTYGTDIASSTDAQTWKVRQTGISDPFRKVIYANGTFVAVGSNGIYQSGSTIK